MKAAILIIVSILICGQSLIAQKMNDLVVYQDKVFVATDKGVCLLSPDGQSLIPMNKGMGEVEINHVKANSNTLVACTPKTEIFLSKDMGESWISIRKKYEVTDERYTNLAITEKYIYAGFFQHLQVLSLSDPDYKMVEEYSNVENVLVLNNNVFVSKYNGLYQVNEEKNKLQSISMEGLYKYKGSYPLLNSMASDGYNIYISVDTWAWYEYPIMAFKSSQMLDRWTPISELKQSVSCVGCIGNCIITAGDKKLCYSLDGCKSWKDAIINTTYQYHVYRNMVAAKGLLYALYDWTDNGFVNCEIVCSADSGKTWYEARRSGSDKSIYADKHFDLMYNKEGLKNLAFKKYNEAIESFSKAITSNDTNYKYFILRGSAYDHLGKYEAAEADYAKAKLLDPKCGPEIYNARATEDEKKHLEWFNSTMPCDECNGRGVVFERGRTTVYEKPVDDPWNYEVPMKEVTTTTTKSGDVRCSKCNGIGRLPKNK